MSFAQGSRSGLSYVVESSFGVTPSTPSMIAIPYNSQSLNLTKETLESEEIREDRQITESRHGNRQIGGDIAVELRAADVDDLLESAFFGAFTTAGVLKVGTTPQYLTIEDRATDISQYRVFTGCACSSMSMSIAPNQMAQTTFSMIGKDMEISGTSLDASPTAVSGNDPFDAYSGTITEGGSAIAIVTSLEFTIENGMNPTFVVGSATTPQLEYGRARVSGTVTAYFQDAALINKFVNETESDIVFALTDGTNTYTFDFHKVKYNGADVPTEGEGSRTISLPFIALYDSVEGTNLTLTKS